MKRLFMALLICVTSSLFGISDENFAENWENLVRPFFNSFEKGEFAGVNGVAIKYVKKEVENEKGALILLHGKSGSYIKIMELAYDLSDLGYSVYMMDHRGFGFSDRMSDDKQIAFVEKFDHYVSDLKYFIDEIVKPETHEKTFAWAHSMGGAILTKYLIENQDSIDAAVLSAPMLDVNTDPYPEWAVYTLTSAATFFGKGDKPAPGEDFYGVTPFEEVTWNQSKHRYEFLMHNLIGLYPEIKCSATSNRWLKESVKATWDIKKAADQITTPFLMIQGGNDTLVDNPGLDEVCDKADDCTKFVFENAMHEVYNENYPVRAEYLELIKDFFNFYE